VPVTVQRGEGEAVLEVLLTAPERARLGLTLVRGRGDDLVPRVEQVEDDSAAAAAGLVPGDEIVEWAGKRLEFSSRDERRAFDRALRTSVNVGDIVPVKVRRGEDEVDLRLVGR
jgi:S1-C subfamily serine protease